MDHDTNETDENTTKRKLSRCRDESRFQIHDEHDNPETNNSTPN